MVRQISASTPTGSNPSSEASELARWLTRELRVKGSPLPSSRPSLPPAGGQQGDERESLEDWLVRDLVPKHRPLASVAVPPSEAPALRREPFLKEASFADPGALRDERPWSLEESWLDAGRPSTEPAWPSTAPLPRERREVREVVDAPLPIDISSLGDTAAPNLALAVSEAPPALAPPEPDLEDDDLAVLPGRRRSSTSRQAKLALALLLAMIALGILLVVRLGQEPSGEFEAAVGDGAPVEGALLPPPPASSPTPSDTEPDEARVERRAKAARAEPEGPLDPRDPRFSLGGPNVRRYADVPSPTLSRLAREQRRLARERDEAIRKAKAAEAAAGAAQGGPR